MMRYIPHTLLPLLMVSAVAQAQVLITEVQSNPAGSSNSDAEWIELHNTGSATVAIGGWSLTDYVGEQLADNVNPTKWAFPGGTFLAPNDVIIIAKTASGFQRVLGLAPTYELGLGSNNSTSTPDLMSVGGNSVIALSNSGTGDAVVLYDDGGAIIDAMEWGTLDRTVMGTPAVRPGDGQSLIRVGVTGSSHVDFVVTNTLTPFIGYGANLPPVISDQRQSPRHPIFGDIFTVSATATDMDGISEVSVYLTTATSTTGPAIMPYQEITMTASTASRYVFSAPVENLAAGLGFNEPSTFHERFIRYFIAAEDTIATRTTFPPDATELTTNENYIARNILPTAPLAIEQVRQQDQTGFLFWQGLSVRVKGRTTSHGKAFRKGRTNFTLDDGRSGIFVDSDRDDTPLVLAGVEVVVTGRLRQFRGRTQIAEPWTIELVDPTVMPVEAHSVASISELLTYAETLESRLVTLSNLQFVEATQVWSTDGPGDGSNYRVTDGTGEIIVRVWEDAALENVNAPSGLFTLTAVLSQHSTGGSNSVAGGYQLWPRTSDDVIEDAPTPDAGTPVADSGSTQNTDAGTGGGNMGLPDSGVVEVIDLNGNQRPAVADDGCSCYAAGPLDEAQLVWPLFLLLSWMYSARRRRS